MKKIILFTFVLVLCSQVFALNYTGFNATFTGTTIQDVTVEASTKVLSSTATGMIKFTVKCNYDNWHVVAFGPGLVNGTHTIPLTVKSVTTGAVAPTTFDALGATEATATALQTGNYTPTGTTYDLYLKGNATALAAARAGYYGAYVNLKITDVL